MKIRLAIIIGLLLMFAFGLVVAQEEGTTYYPTVYEYPNGNTMTNDIKLNTYYFYVYELLPLNADGEWGFIAFKQEGGIKGRGYLDIDIQGMRVVGYPDYMDTYEQKLLIMMKSSTTGMTRDSLHKEQNH